MPLVRRAVGESVMVECVVGAGLWNTMVDASEFHSAVLNLAINGRDAMPNGGKLTIEVSNAALDDTYAAQHAEVEPGQYVLFAITDTGIGMDAATVAQVLDPFFTTKPPGEGTGLGLPQVYGFVKQSGGHIKIYSEEGHGTSVKIYLPRSTGVQETEYEALQNVPITGGDETILIVEDDALVRQYVVTQVKSLGYAALEAANAAEALIIIDADKAIDLLFTDVIMPGNMNGRQLADEAARRRPDLKTLFTSGYTENAIVHHGRLDSGVLLLAKPYRKSELARMLRTALAS
jgi:CheY-like chemotaxis protein